MVKVFGVRHWNLTECEEKLYFSPLSAKNIGVYNKKTKEFSSIPLHLGDQECNLERKFSDAFTYGKYGFVPVRIPSWESMTLQRGKQSIWIRNRTLKDSAIFRHIKALSFAFRVLYLKF